MTTELERVKEENAQLRERLHTAQIRLALIQRHTDGLCRTTEPSTGYYRAVSAFQVYFKDVMNIRPKVVPVVIMPGMIGRWRVLERYTEGKPVATMLEELGDIEAAKARGWGDATKLLIVEEVES